MIGRLNMNEKLHDITLNGIMLDIIVYRRRKNNLQHTSNFKHGFDALMFCLLFTDSSVENMIPGVTSYGMLLDAWGKII
jgi:hypothetical protein